MIKYFIIIIIMFLLPGTSYSQVENIPSDNPVYNFIKSMQVRGIVPGYDDIVLPKSREEVVSLLNEIKNEENQLSKVESDLVDSYLEKLEVRINENENTEDSFFWSQSQHLFYYKDSSLTFTMNPIAGTRYLHLWKDEESKDNGALLLKLGGNFYGSYDDWFGFFLEGSNEILWGSRETALKDLSVAQSFTFNETGINYIDFTSGYIRMQKGDVSLELGRERLLWGTGYNDRVILSDNPPIFDFIRFNFNYKIFNYSFVHGWLVQRGAPIQVDSFFSIQTKPSKYIALSRLGFNPAPQLKFGISQFIIYANRPFEAAYLNPFLFWESAQRSMNDLDNSFLSLDARILITDGLEINSSITLDDIHFGRLFSDGWNIVDNRNMWNAGIMLTEPIVFSNFMVGLDYVEVRPYMFSHPGIDEMLTYTNNGYLLGTPLNPNSRSINVLLGYNFSYRLSVDFKYNYYLHGENIRDSNGELIRNVGGNVLEYFSYFDSGEVHLLDGNLVRFHLFALNIQYEPYHFLYLKCGFNLLKTTDFENQLYISASYKVL